MMLSHLLTSGSVTITCRNNIHSYGQPAAVTFTMRVATNGPVINATATATMTFTQVY